MPLWNEEWIVRNIPGNAKLKVKVFNKDDDKFADGYIGQIKISRLIHYRKPSKGESIVGSLGQMNGFFHLLISATLTRKENHSLPRYTFDGPCRYFRHNSSTIDALTRFRTNRTYSTWKIELRRVSQFFPPNQQQHWNRQYQAAKLIFGKYPTSLLSRATIKIAYRNLYGRTLKRNQNGYLLGADDLWKTVFSDPTLKRIRPCIYTYVIEDSTWLFGETGRQFWTDFASKHALLSNGSRQVRYAGEFHIRPKYGWDRTDDEWELVFDNGSGTYAPSCDLLTNLKELMELNFPGLNIVTYEYRDPLLHESIKQVKEQIRLFRQLTPATCLLVNSYDDVTSF